MARVSCGRLGLDRSRVTPRRPLGRPPLLLHFRHLEKTGGTTIREWLLRNAGKRPNIPRREQRPLSQRLDGFVRYYEARCFWCVQFPELHTDAAKRACADLQADCAGRKKRVYGHEWRVAGSWRHRGTPSVASARRRPFLRSTSSARPKRLRLYAAHNGTAASLVVLRELRAHPLGLQNVARAQRRRADHVRRLARSAGGAQTGMFGSRARRRDARARHAQRVAAALPAGGGATRSRGTTSSASRAAWRPTCCASRGPLGARQPADARVRDGVDGRPPMKLEKLYEAAWSERKTCRAAAARGMGSAQRFRPVSPPPPRATSRCTAPRQDAPRIVERAWVVSQVKFSSGPTHTHRSSFRRPASRPRAALPLEREPSARRRRRRRRAAARARAAAAALRGGGRRSLEVVVSEAGSSSASSSSSPTSSLPQPSSAARPGAAATWREPWRREPGGGSPRAAAVPVPVPALLLLSPPSPPALASSSSDSAVVDESVPVAAAVARLPLPRRAAPPASCCPWAPAVSRPRPRQPRRRQPRRRRAGARARWVERLRTDDDAAAKQVEAAQHPAAEGGARRSRSPSRRRRCCCCRCRRPPPPSRASRDAPRLGGGLLLAASLRAAARSFPFT